MYTSIRPKNFIFFLKEAEYRRYLSNLDYRKIIEDFANTFSTLCEEVLTETEFCNYEYETNMMTK